MTTTPDQAEADYQAAKKKGDDKFMGSIRDLLKPSYNTTTITTMSDSEGAAGSSHVHNPYGGKSLASIVTATGSGDRPRYKSWRKKYRKMRANFDGVLEDNRRMFREEQKMEATAKRLREELDGILDLLLSLNENPSLPSTLRYDITLPRHNATNHVPPDITPEQANDMLDEYTTAVHQGRLPPLDLHIIRESLETRLALQDVPTLSQLETSIPQPMRPGSPSHLPPDLLDPNPPGYLTPDQESAYLARLDAKLGDPYNFSALPLSQSNPSQEETNTPSLAEMTPREFERQAEMQNPQSQHNWLRTHAKPNQVAHPMLGGLDNGDEGEGSVAGDVVVQPKKRRQKKGGADRDLAKRVGERAVETARAKGSPGAGGAGFGDDDVDGGMGGYEGFGDVGPVAAKKKGKDPDSTYRVKGGKSGGGGGGGGGGGKGKRKRVSGEDGGEKEGTPGTASKKAKIGNGKAIAAPEGGAVSAAPEGTEAVE